MQRKKISTLLVLSLLVSSIPVLYFISTVNDNVQSEKTPSKLNVSNLADRFGERIPVVVHFEDELSSNSLGIIDDLNLKFSLGSASKSHIGPYYLLEGSSSSLETLSEMGFVTDIALQTQVEHLESTMMCGKSWTHWVATSLVRISS